MSELTGEEREALDNWLLLAALRDAYTELHDLHHISSKSWDIDFVHCASWVCRKNRGKLLEWGLDVTALAPWAASDTGSEEGA